MALCLQPLLRQSGSGGWMGPAAATCSGRLAEVLPTLHCYTLHCYTPHCYTLHCYHLHCQPAALCDRCGCRLGGSAPGVSTERLQRMSPRQPTATVQCRGVMGGGGSKASTRLAHYVEWVTHQRHLTVRRCRAAECSCALLHCMKALLHVCMKCIVACVYEGHCCMCV